MSALDVFLIPGTFLLGLLLNVFGIAVAQQYAMPFLIVAGFISWIVWIILIKVSWFATLRLLGFA